ncbi:hypothetical protein [Shewanella xiamenensis]|uniref:hypothetical protein n=1 Tax=Shewanella xiamenensis TaxID=332186 RepID=UPI002E7AF10E|nr:hypothetical protein [Shewanella xiamenensis]
MKTEDIQFKLEEIKFHLELLYAIEESGKSLTLINNPEKEASYLVSAVLNAFYSLTEMCGGKGNQYVKEFREIYPSIYAGSGKGGLRNTTVHVAHKRIDFSGYISPQNGRVNFHFKETPKLAPLEKSVGKVTLRFSPNFYLKINGEMVAIVDYFHEHLGALKKLVSRLGVQC